MKRGSDSKAGVYFEFFEAVKTAEAQAVARSVATIQAASRKSWQAAAWWLERKHPDEWGRKERHEHVGKDGEPIKLDMDPRDALLARLETIARNESMVNHDGGGKADHETA